MIEREQSLLGQRRQELDGEERIAGGLLVHQLRQRGRRAPARSESASATNRPEIVAGEGRKDDLLHDRSGLADRLELAHQRMGGRDLVVPIGADQQQVLHIRLGQQVLEQIERRRVEPLQIVEEQRERMLRPREHAEEAPEHQLEAALRVLWRQARGPAAARR